MAWLRRAPDDAAAARRSSSRERCQRQSCAAKLINLKSEVKELEAQLRPLQRLFNSEVEGQVRRVHAELAAATSQRDDACASKLHALHQRNAAYKRARDLAVENELLLSKVAALSSSYASLMGKHASSEKKRKSESRQAAQRERQLNSRLTVSEARASAAEQRTAEAVEAEERALEAEHNAEERVAEAQHAADEANAEAEAAAADAEAARRESSDAGYVQVVLEAKLARAEARAAEKQAKLYAQRAELLKGPANRTVDEWAALGREAEWKAAQRERRYLSEFISNHDFRPKDIAASLDELNLVKALFKEQPFFQQHFEHVQALVKRLEEEHFGETFGAFLHYEMNLTFEKILRLTQAASKKFDKGLDHYTSKVLLYDPFCKDQVVMVPRLAPPKHKLAMSKKAIESKLNVQSGEDGRLAFVPIHNVIKQLLARDPGTGGRAGHCMPPLSHFLGGVNKLPLVIQFDGTGFGSGQFNTIALNNPYTSQSAQLLYIIGLGNCSDDRSGTARLLGPNLQAINDMARSPECCLIVPEGKITPEFFMTVDLSSLSLWRLSGKAMTPSPRRSVLAPKSFLSVEMHCDVPYPMVALATPRTLSSPPLRRRVPAADICLRHEPPDFATRLVSAFCSSREDRQKRQMSPTLSISRVSLKMAPWGM